jgi:predicted dehydrogenase
MDRKYKVVVVGMGKRGLHHAAAFKANGRFEIVGLCDIDQVRLDAAAAKFGVGMKGTGARLIAMEIQLLRTHLSDEKVMLSSPRNANEYQ